MLNAIRIFISHRRQDKEIGWNKTTHDFIPGDIVFYKRLGDILLENGLITEITLQHAIELQKENGKMLGEILIDMLQMHTSDLAKAIAHQKNLPYQHISEEDVDFESIHKIDRLLLLEHDLLPLKVMENDKYIVVSSNLVIDVILDKVQFAIGHPVKLHISASQMIERILH